MMHDDEIVEMYFARDERAIEETERKFGKLCFGIAKRILRDESDAHECVNDAYHAVWNSIPPTRPKLLLPFVAKVARNISLKRYEYNTAKKRTTFEPVDISELEEVLADNSDLYEKSDEDLGGMISDFLNTEKEDARNVFMRKYFFFDSVSDIAERYSFSESKVKSMLFQSRNRLKEYLKNKGVNV